ncbi:MAG: FHA domain-containing protein [Planctomycetota bacterium]|nr:MAG: FHA domain-containing protein [Planctomycetota bacterium]
MKHIFYEDCMSDHEFENDEVRLPAGGIFDESSEIERSLLNEVPGYRSVHGSTLPTDSSKVASVASSPRIPPLPALNPATLNDSFQPMPDPQAQASVVPESPLWKPTIRHPMALLKIVDDGNDEGETIRMRGDKVLIGRTEGDVVISHDITMAPRHASITRVPNGTWELTDLGSPEGTFLRVTSATLRRGSTILIGSTKLLFTPAADESDEVDALMEVRLFGAGERFPLEGQFHILGNGDPACTLRISDAYVSPLHAVMTRTERGWKIENRGINGLWMQINAPIRMRQPTQFQCGEQRFIFVPLS